MLDIGQASEIVAAVLKEYHLHNLDELFPEENTTTEWMCEEGSGRPAARARVRECRRCPGAHKSGGTLRRLCLEEPACAACRVTLHESHKAKASFERSLRAW